MATAEVKAVDEAFKEGQQAAKKTSELAAVKAENETMKKAMATLQRGYNHVATAPNTAQLGIALGVAAGTAVAGYKLNEVLEEKTAEWVDEESGERTTAAKIVQHGTAPLIGLILIGLGAMAKNGLTASAALGGGGGLIIGSAVRSMMIPATDEETADA